MTNPLQQALVPLAEKAGVKTGISNMGVLYYVGANGLRKYISLQNGSLEGEVEVVLGWLAKAGYSLSIWETRNQKPNVTRVTITDYTTDNPRQGCQESAATLHEALAEAVKALPREDA